MREREGEVKDNRLAGPDVSFPHRIIMTLIERRVALVGFVVTVLK